MKSMIAGNGLVQAVILGCSLFAADRSSIAMAQEHGPNPSSWSTTVQPGRPWGGSARDRRVGPRGSQEIQDTPIQKPPDAPASTSYVARLGSPAAVAEAPPAIAVAKSLPQNDAGTDNSAVMEYCRNIQPAASEARAAFLQQSIAALERQLEHKTAELEVRITEFKQWVARRQQMVDQASSALVQMFTRMRPEAAAQQIAVMDETVAAALLMKLDAKTASALLSEVPPARAARLTAVMIAPPEQTNPARFPSSQNSVKRQEEQGHK